ncbi:acetyltransferase [Rhizobium sp. Root274]|uniref:GNAT family N-acetyltransferase n=1 Tax=unclassified Rhizobium TaxID=2613769 RepID=UPI000714ACCD|nr:MULTISPECIES: GNAT family protein [unclassified Rhizobium]KQW29393.1 acetyltransferase [Rhizobium sp. Root1240]KRD29585.1 acetyltransferase [Rhizobium sp. Root274]
MRDLSTFKGCAAPQPVRLEGRFVVIEPYNRATHLEALWEGLGGIEINPLLKYFTQPDFNDIADFDVWLTAVQKGGWVTEVFRDKATGKVVGMANYMRPDPANGVVEIGGVAHGPDMSRTPLATEAHYLLAQHVFEDLGYRRYEWKCHNENAPSKASALRYGFQFEGVFRQHMLSKGKNRDTAWFSMIDGEWPLLAAAFEAWLSPDNFDGEGKQKQKLEDLRASLAAKRA